MPTILYDDKYNFLFKIFVEFRNINLLSEWVPKLYMHIIRISQGKTICWLKKQYADETMKVNQEEIHSEWECEWGACFAKWNSLLTLYSMVCEEGFHFEVISKCKWI